MKDKTTFNFVVDSDQLERLRRRSRQEERSVGSLIREGLEFVLTSRTYEQGLRDCSQYLRSSTLISGNDLPDGRTHNEFLADEMISTLKK